MSEEEDKKAKARNWVMTLFCNEKYATLEAREEQIKKMPDWVKHVRYGREKTKEGKDHLQCYVEGWNPVRWTQFKAWIGDSFRQPMYGRLLDNDQYTAKEGSYVDLGERPMQGRRTDLIGAKRRLDNIQPGESIYRIAREEEPMFGHIAKYSRFMQEYVNDARMEKLKKDFSKPEVIYVYGPPGSGKDKYVDEHYPELYDVPAADGYKWKDGYNGEPVVVYRNISPSSVTNPNQLLKELDRRVCRASTKGSFVPWKPSTILLTSIWTMDQMAARFDVPSEWTRRITRVEYIKDGKVV